MMSAPTVATSSRSWSNRGGPEDVSHRFDEEAAWALDEEALHVLSNFRPALDDLFSTVCSCDSTRDGQSGSTQPGRPMSKLSSSSSTPLKPFPASYAWSESLPPPAHPSIPVSYASPPEQPLEVDAAAAAALAAISHATGMMPQISESPCESDEEPETVMEYESSIGHFNASLLRTPLSSIVESGSQGLWQQIDAIDGSWEGHAACTTDSGSVHVPQLSKSVSRQSMNQEQFLHICREL